jgi:hypothetical protein
MLMGWCSPAIHSTYILEPDTLTHTDRQTGRQSVNQTDTYTHTNTNTNTHTDTNTHTLTQRQRHIFYGRLGPTSATYSSVRLMQHTG